MSDGNKQYSGTFQRESHTLQARMLPSENVVIAETGYSSRLQLIGDDVASITSGTDSLNEWTAHGSNNAVQPNEQEIHNTANNIAMAGDELNDEYKGQLQVRKVNHLKNLSLHLFTLVKFVFTLMGRKTSVGCNNTNSIRLIRHFPTPKLILID